MDSQDYQILVPYKDILALMEAPKAIADQRQQLHQLRREIDGIRSVQSDILFAIGELRDLIAKK